MYSNTISLIAASLALSAAAPTKRSSDSTELVRYQDAVIRLTVERPAGLSATDAVPIATGAAVETQQPQYVVAENGNAMPSSAMQSEEKSNPSAAYGGEIRVPECGNDEPAIIIQNEADHDICYMVELSQESTPVSDLNATCGPGNGFMVAASSSARDFCLGENFIGALTAFHQGNATSHVQRSNTDDNEIAATSRSFGETRGTRFEFNFDDKSRTWYNVDYEMGLDSSTLAPHNGSASFTYGEQTGEEDLLAKVNEAYQSLSSEDKATHAQHGYLVIGRDGEVQACSMDKEAPDVYVKFLQVTAGLQGYVNPGSVVGEQSQRQGRFGKDGVHTADSMSKVSDARWFVIRSF